MQAPSADAPRAPPRGPPPPLACGFYGVGVQLDCEDPALAEQLARDFSFFRTPAVSAPQVQIRCHCRRPPWEDLPRGRVVLVQPHFVAFSAAGQRWVDYQGQALVRWSFAAERGEVWGTDPGLLHEVLYLLVHSRVGELLDRRGLHRVHALSLQAGQRAVLCLLPSGGGKTTLGLGALGTPGVKLLSDDIALLDRDGQVLPFPLRVGCAEPPAGVDPRHLRRFHRRQHGAKWLVDIEAFAGRVGDGPVPPAALVLGQRQLGGAASLRPVARKAAAGPLLREMVVGLGLPQLVEYFLRLDLRDLGPKTELALSRLAAGARLLSRVRTYRLRLGRDGAANAALLRGLLQEVAA